MDMTAAPRAVPASLNGWNAEYLDEQYRQFQRDPASLPEDLRAFYRGFDLATERGGGSTAATPFDVAVQRLAEGYRVFGHLAAKVDPLGRPRKAAAPLSLGAYGLGESDLDRTVGSGGTLRDLVTRLETAYCGSTGAEFMHCDSPDERAWFLERFEGPAVPIAPAQRAEILRQVTVSETFEKWLGKRYQGKKRFSLEGAESMIPLMRSLANRAGELGVREIVLGMAHRGRLNILRHFLGKDTERLITEFEDSWADGLEQGGGDVKYHRGYSGDQATSAGTVHLSMLNNPSHLESVNALVMGRTRCLQEVEQEKGEVGRDLVVGLLVHGDAALSGQGVVSECLNMSYLEGYTVGGTLHVVINNQVGFTTDVRDDRSTEYCTDIAKMINAPVLHVNGDDPEACVRAAVTAIEYRHRFHKDIFIDMVCFRRYGHNEQDEPAYTQPEMYAIVRAHPGTRAIYAERLAAEGVVSADDAQAMVDTEVAVLDRAQEAARAKPVNPVPPPGQGRWAGFVGAYSFETPKTAVDEKTLASVCAALGRTPDGFAVHPKLKGLLESRSRLPETRALNHADAELLAVGTLLAEGTPVRLSGQDSRRGTFTQRHSVLRDEKTGEKYTSVNHVRSGQALLSAWDSPLSEYAVVGFDYGYCRANPKCLVMWEAQFGDFCNTAQVVVDQYMAASEAKWNRWTGLVLLLPHGYEGQGPEHSSARLERFLLLCADQNMEVVYPSTGAQHFHMLRRHMKRNFRKPLIVMTPKKYLRAETSTLDELAKGEFRHLIDDAAIDANASKGVSRVVYCCGKFYHELRERLTASGRRDIAIVRVEQLYPFHTDLGRSIDARYPKTAERVWAQEEPRNAGAFTYIADVFRESLGISLRYVGRPASASPATGSEHAHKKQQSAILDAAIGPAPASAPEHGNAVNGVSKPDQQAETNRGAPSKNTGSKSPPAARRGGPARATR